MKDFEETKELSQPELFTLLAQGDARERVLAIWALALRVSGTTTMANQLRTEPDAGVRRALAVVLASAGEIDLLVAMCRHDPSVYVRASAVQMLVRFALAERVPWSLVRERLADAAEVRAGLVSQLDATAPVELRADAVAMLRDADDMVRREAFETCAKLCAAGVIEGESLRAFLDEASFSDRATMIAKWFEIERVERIAEMLAPANRDTRAVALKQRPMLALTTLASLVRDRDDLAAVLPAAMRASIDELSLALLVEIVTASPWAVAHRDALQARLETLSTVSADEAPRLAALAHAVRNTILDLDGEAGADDMELAVREDTGTFDVGIDDLYVDDAAERDAALEREAADRQAFSALLASAERLVPTS